MVAVAVETSINTVTITKGTPVADATFATVGGAVLGLSIIKREETSDTVTYDIIIVHDTVGSSILEYSVNQKTKLKGTDQLDIAYATVAGAVQGVAVSKVEERGDTIIYDVFVVHLDA